MAEKRYSIVRVDDNCPFMQEKLDFSSCSKMFNCDKFIRCEKCEHNCRYGDTKEQMVRKVAQTMLRKFLKGYLGNAMQPKLAKEQIEIVYKNYLEIAKEIVELLGVVE